MSYIPRLTQQSHKVILAFLAYGRVHLCGAEICNITGLQSGTVYPILCRFEKAGWLTSYLESAQRARSEGRPRKRNYRRTAIGTKQMKTARIEIGSYLRSRL